MQASEEPAVVLALEVVGIPEDSVALVEVEAMVLDWMVQVEAAWVEVSEQAQEVAAAVMDPMGALVDLAQEVSAATP